MNETSKSGIIFNIQKFSLNDGPGIRTVIFFKGCPLKCKWCANPESQSSKFKFYMIKKNAWVVKKCIAICPSNAISNKNDEIFIDDSLCLGCQKCVINCPGHALKSEGENKTVTEILNICLQDKVFYEESGGGITLSGGEALMQPDFSIAILKSLKSFNIHTAIETTGFASPEIFDKVTNYIDLLLFDIKHWNEKKHIEGTSASNKLILQNMKRAIASGKKVLPRLPVIPGFNNTLEDALGFAQRLHEVGSSKVQLLPFHQFGEKKYDMLGKEYSFSNIPALHEEDLMEFRQIFIDNGIDAFF